MYNTCLPNIQTPSVFGATGWTEIWFLRKGHKTKWLVTLVWQNYWMLLFLEISKKITEFGSIPTSMWKYYGIVRIVFFPYSHDMRSTTLCFPFTFSHSANARKTETFLCVVIEVSFSYFHGFPFNTFWGQERQTFLFLWAFPSLSASSDCWFWPTFLVKINPRRGSHP